MKNLKLTNLTLKNFKGIKHFELQTDGENARIFGDNATGKTTLFDGFVWLLFGKDSNNRADFSIKTLDHGKEINNLEHEVSASFLFDGRPMSLRKVYKEKWTRKRGAATAEFTGHETDHYIDEVPVKKKEYLETVDSIVQEEVFKLLTNPLYFNEQMKWQDRRKTLLEVCGDVEFEDVLAFNKDLADLPAILKGRAIEDHRKVIASRRAAINKELENIPVRISEVQNTLPEQPIDVSGLDGQVAEIETKLDENATLINNIRNGSVITDKQQKLRQIEMDLQQIKRDVESDSLDEVNRLKAKLQEEQSNVTIMQSKKQQTLGSIDLKQNHADALETERKGLLETYHQVNGQEFSRVSDCECPTCGQSLPEEQVQAAREKALADFNLQKSNKLEAIKEKGVKLKETIESIQNEIEREKISLADADSDIEKKSRAITKLQEDLAKAENNIQDVTQDERYKLAIQDRTDIEAAIQKLQANAQDAVADIESQQVELRARRLELNAQLAQQAQVVTAEKRIAELEEQQSELAKEFEELEHQLYLTESFIRSKVELLEEKINSKFKHARFKLFSTQVNGGLQEVCETTFEGVPYSSGLNNAAKINVGIDIINTLTEHFGIRAPIFVDNAEAVTQIADTDSQLISLVVSEPDKQLRIESQSSEESVVA
ncbi:ATPase involved in DNA repair [Lysinibacillus sphaericus]|nr:ATPase involved in DNA repair [Lysinibacillus sphaericus]